jgi:predicted Zn-dependent peptidase
MAREGLHTRARIGDGVWFSHIPDPKFKRNLISINFIMPLLEDTASANAVVPYILRRSCRACPDFSAFQARLEELYGASLSAGISKINSWQIVGVSISGLDGRFALDGEDIAGECASLLANVSLDPKLVDGAFDAKDTELERKFIVDSIEAEINDKRALALQRCMRIMCAGEPVATRKYGSLESAKAVTPQSAYAAYMNMLETAQIEISFTGCGDPSSAKRIFTEAFAGVERKPVAFSLTPLRTSADTIKEETETMSLSQAKLVMGFRCGELVTDEDINTMRLCSAILGGTPFSKFFLNVRERLSLCYYCASSFDQFNRLLVVDSGIEAANKQLAQDEILRQIKATQEGEITDEELANTKLLVANSLTRGTDSPSSMESWYMLQALKNRNLTPQEDAALIAAITKEQVVAAAKKLSLDTVFVLTGNGEEEYDGEVEE